jgi:hypothetical protein
MYILRMKITGTSEQRELNDLWRTRLSRRRITWLLSHPLPSPTPLSPVSSTGKLRKKDNSLTGGGVGEWVGGRAKSDDNEKAWSSINHAILSASE